MVFFIVVVMLFMAQGISAQGDHEHFPSDPEFTIEMKEDVEEIYYTNQISLRIGVVVYNEQDTPDEAIVGMRYDFQNGAESYVYVNRSSGYISAHGDIDVFFEIELDEPLDTEDSFSHSIQFIVMNETNRIQDTTSVNLFNRGYYAFVVGEPKIEGYGGELKENNPVQIYVKVSNQGTGTYPFIAVAYADGDEVGYNMGYGLANRSEEVEIVWSKPKEGDYDIMVEVQAIEGWDPEEEEYILGEETAESGEVSVSIGDDGEDIPLLIWIFGISFIVLLVLLFLLYRKSKKQKKEKE
jgi:hypothetical protein